MSVETVCNGLFGCGAPPTEMLAFAGLLGVSLLVLAWLETRRPTEVRR